MKCRFDTTVVFSILCSAFLPYLCAKEPQASLSSYNCSHPNPAKVQQQYGDSFDWDRCTPNDFLNFLQKLNQGFYFVGQQHKGWVKEKDLPVLFALIDSNQPCANVASVVSSFIDLNKSTVGNEAAWLISSFRSGEYPPGLNSTRPKPNKKELKRWWKDRLGSSGGP
jgi:hypothetical protein